MTVTFHEQALGNLVHVRVTGKLRHADYEHFVPIIDRCIARHGSAKVLFEMHDFHGWTAGALWDDLEFGIQHIRSIDRMAFVGERPWQRGMSTFCKPFTMARIRYFDSGDLAAAHAWLSEEHGQAQSVEFDFEDVEQPVADLLRTLDGADGLARQDARAQLVKMGASVTGPLIRAAHGGSVQLRLEATKALSEIAAPATAKDLAKQFEDFFEIGWAASEGLKKMGVIGAKAVLEEVVQHPDLHVVRTSAHHALRRHPDAAIRDVVDPVAEALADQAPVDQAPVAAFKALARLDAI